VKTLKFVRYQILSLLLDLTGFISGKKERKREREGRQIYRRQCCKRERRKDTETEKEEKRRKAASGGSNCALF
jgi:hypothetical protein